MITMHQRYTGQTDRRTDDIRWHNPVMKYHGAGIILQHNKLHTQFFESKQKMHKYF